MEWPPDKKRRVDNAFVTETWSTGADWTWAESTAAVSTECEWSGLNSFQLVCYGMVSSTTFAPPPPAFVMSY
jgi:hypothetical protein